MFTKMIHVYRVVFPIFADRIEKFHFYKHQTANINTL